MPQRPRTSAGIVLFRVADAGVEVLLGHMGGPFWARRDERAWSVVKGEHDDAEDAFDAARREWREETGSELPGGPAIDLGEVRQAGGKRVRAWAVEGDFDPAALRSATFTLEWPPRSGRTQEFPELDRAAWFGLDAARAKIVAGQVPFLDALERERLRARADAPAP
jgi:predicted NUDIX family NTP pyrophosphohydrolase